MNVLEAILKRRSMRSWKPAPVEKEKIIQGQGEAGYFLEKILF